MASRSSPRVCSAIAMREDITRPPSGYNITLTRISTPLAKRQQGPIRPRQWTRHFPFPREQVAPIKRPLAIANWLLAVAALVFLMVVVGGITRLTESGLSITEWKPVTGAIPPLTHADWSHAFDLYKQTPEYREINGPAGMTLAQFKFIFFWEWLHRLIGRLIGVAFAVPLLWFAAKRAIPQGYGWKLVGLLVLGGLQGLLGWYMVMSGLVDRTDVSHFRLSAHLLLAFAIMGALIWVALDLRQLARTGEDRPARLNGAAVATIAVLFVQLLLGAWVAGLNAGPGRQRLAADAGPPLPRRRRLVERRPCSR